MRYKGFNLVIVQISTSHVQEHRLGSRVLAQIVVKQQNF